MAIPTIPRQAEPDKPFQLHVPSFTTTSCIQCGAGIEDLEAWLATECPGEWMPAEAA